MYSKICFGRKSAGTARTIEVNPEKLLSGLSYTHFEQLIEIEDLQKRTFYEIETLRGSWSTRELKRQIATQYYERSVLSNNKKKLSDNVQTKCERQNPLQVIRDPYASNFWVSSQKKSSRKCIRGCIAG